MLDMVLLGVCSACACPLYLSWTLFKSPGLWGKFDLDSILGKGYHLFKIIGKFRYLGMEDVPQEFSIKNCSINVEFLENKTGEITAGVYLLSIVENRNSVRQIGTGALLFVNNYVLGLILGNDSTIYLSDSHSKDGHGNLSSSGTAVLLKFDTLHSLQSYIKSVYYSCYPLTLYFQVQFIKVDCTASTKNATKYALKKERLSARRERDLAAKKENIMRIQERKYKQLKRDTMIRKKP